MENLVGRLREVSLLNQRLAGANQGNPSLQLLSGEPGIGKSALAWSIHKNAMDDGFSAAWGRCWEAGKAPAFWPWKVIIAECIQCLGIDRFRSIMARACAIEDLPESLRGGLFASSAGSVAELKIATVHEGVRMRIFDGVREVLSEACHHKPMLLVFDDLHAADASSVLLLLYIVQRFSSERLLIIGTYRNTQVPNEESVTPLLAKLAREGEESLLSGLSETEALELYQQIKGKPPAENVFNSLTKSSGGNPLFLTELARLNELDGNSPLLVIADVVAQRIERLPPETREVLVTASLIGREFDLFLLASATRMSVPVLAGVLDKASIAQVIQPSGPDNTGDNTQGWKFSHDIMREYLASQLDSAERTRRHHAIAMAMDNVNHSGNISAAITARHYCFSVPMIKAELAAERVLDVAHDTLRSGAYEEAQELSELALHTLASSGVKQNNVTAKILLVAANAALALGEFDKAKEQFDLAFNAALELESGTLAIRAALGYGALNEVGRTGPSLVKRLEQALALADDNRSELRCLALGRLAQVLHNSTRKTEAVSYAHEARALAEGLGDPIVEAQVILFTIHVLQTPNNVDERISDSNRAIELAREAGSARVEFLAHESRIRHALEGGNAMLADASREIVRQIASELKNRLPTWLWMTHRASRVCMDGEFEAGEKLLTEALEYGCEHANHNAWLMYFTAIHEVYWNQNIIAKALPTIEEICRKAPAASAAHTGRIWIQAHCDNNHDAFKAELDRYVKTEFREVPRDAVWLASMGMLGETAAIIRYRHAAEAIYRQLSPHAEQHAMIYHGSYRGSIQRVLGLLAHCLGNFKNADKHFEQAIAAERQLRAKAYECYARLDRVAAIIDPDNAVAGDPTALEVANTELSHVEKCLEQLTIPRAEHQLKSLRANLAAPAISAAPLVSSGWQVHLSNDGEYWSLAVNNNSTHRLRDSKGLIYLKMLATKPSKAIPAIELVAAANGNLISETSGLVEAEYAVTNNLGGGDTQLDTKAIQQYKKRILDLQDELNEAEKNNDIGMAAGLRSELEFLTDQLRSATGLGGRVRQPNGHAERARSAVTKALRAALQKIEKLEPEFGRNLQDTVKTGHLCQFSPNPALPIKWQLKE